MATLERAIELAAKAHAGMVDKAGEPYILHPLRVMLAQTNNAARIVAVLHDVVEDCGVTLDDLRVNGFDELVVSGVGVRNRVLMAKATWSLLPVRRFTRSGRPVKKADLEDNADLSRLASPTDADHERTAKYHRAIAILEGTDAI